MKRWMLIASLCMSATACGADEPVPMPQPNGGGDSEHIDYCERFGWYSDGTCDEVCDSPDPDCEQTETPGNPGSPGEPSQPGQPTEPDPGPTPVEPGPEIPECATEDSRPGNYVAFGEECLLIDFACPDDRTYFEDDCGCGCMPEVNADPGLCIDDSTPDVDRIGDVEECARIDYMCAEGWFAFSDDCGCGCRLECTTNADCPDGYCQFGTDAPQICIYPNCDDGSELACRALKPTCEVSETAAVINGCWECVDARSCGPRLGD